MRAATHVTPRTAIVRPTSTPVTSSALTDVMLMRIGMMIVSEYEANPRVRRQAEALAARGDHVTVLALHAAIIWSTLFGRSMTWAGRTYRLDRENRVVDLTRK